MSNKAEILTEAELEHDEELSLAARILCLQRENNHTESEGDAAVSNWDTSTGQVSRVLPHECDHTNCIPRSELPWLPYGLVPPFHVDFQGTDDNGLPWRVCDNGDAVEAGSARVVARCVFEDEAIVLMALLNTCYPAPTATKEG